MTGRRDKVQGRQAIPVRADFSDSVWTRIGIIGERRARRRRAGTIAVLLIVAMATGTGVAVRGEVRAPSGLLTVPHDPVALLDIDG